MLTRRPPFVQEGRTISQDGFSAPVDSAPRPRFSSACAMVGRHVMDFSDNGDGTLTAVRCIDRQADDLDIQFEAGACPVVAVAPRAFEGCTELRRVILPESLRQIGEMAFSGCTHLRMLVIPGGVQRVGTLAFAKCSQLERVRIEPGVVQLGPSSFSKCAALKRVEIPASVTQIGGGAFFGCSKELRLYGAEGVPAQQYAELNGLAFDSQSWKDDEELVLREEGDGTLTVTPKGIAQMTVDSLPDVTYNGESQQQKPVVKDGEKVLVEGVDYELTYSENTTDAGMVTVTVTGKGNYAGSVDVAYLITPASLTVSTPSASGVYNGKPLTAAGSISGFVNGESAPFETTGSQTEVGTSDNTYAIASFVVTVITFVIAIAGYSLLGLQVYIWWIFQLTVLQLIVACDDLLRKYRRRRVDVLVRAYRIKHRNDVGKDKGSFILVTWLYDLVEMFCIPLLYLLSIPFCLYLASEVFDLTEICMDMFFYPFFNYEYLHLSVSKIVLAVGLFYAFKYVCYVARALYRIYKLRKTLNQTGSTIIRESDLNLTLANNVIGILVWGTYFIVTVSLLNIPTKSLSVITAGLAAGLGFAMKDILNNFFYGVQLMSGRLRVGDYIECDGVRGKVENISYQSTQIEATDGSVMAIPNSSLFAKNFKNLTRNHSYEFLGLPVGVAYGTDVERTRKVILRALAPLRKPDKFGRPVIDEKYGVQVVLGGFGDSSVDLVVKQYVLVDQRVGYTAAANERIYNALNEAGIQIPFPQRDINIRQVPSSEK